MGTDRTQVLGIARLVNTCMLKMEGRRFVVGCGGGAIELLEVQLEGKKRMPAAAFLNGFTLSEDEILQ